MGDKRSIFYEADGAVCCVAAYSFPPLKTKNSEFTYIKMNWEGGGGEFIEPKPNNKTRTHELAALIECTATVPPRPSPVPTDTWNAW